MKRLTRILVAVALITTLAITLWKMLWTAERKLTVTEVELVLADMVDGDDGVETLKRPVRVEVA